MKNIESTSIIVQWDAVDLTTYTVFWTNGRDLFEVATVEQTSYTITGLTLDTVYNITVSAANMCGNGPEFRTSVSFPTGTYHFPFINYSPMWLYSYYIKIHDSESRSQEEAGRT